MSVLSDADGLRPRPANVGFAIFGGGLQGAPLALALAGRPLAAIERGATLGVNHLSSFLLRADFVIDCRGPAAGHLTTLSAWWVWLSPEIRA